MPPPARIAAAMLCLNPSVLCSLLAGVIALQIRGFEAGQLASAREETP
jgi:hypothetical protein